MEEPTKAALQLIPAQEMVVEWSQELEYQLKIQNSFNSIQLVFMELVV
jgi:hypothetical protein